MDGKALYECEHVRKIVGTVGVLALLVAFTEMTLRSVGPLLLLFGGSMAHEIVDESYDLPEGSNWLVYGGSVVAVGIYWAVALPVPWIGGLFVLAGLWFVLDGATTIRYEPSQTEPAYVSDLEDEGWSETMLRMQTVNVVYRALTEPLEPRTAPELAEELDLTESRVESALELLAHNDRVEREGDHYRVEPSRWGRLTPVVQFLTWLPRRIGRPFRRVATGG